MVIADAFWLHALVFNVILFFEHQEKQIFLLKIQLVKLIYSNNYLFTKLFYCNF